jgi:hypothetical protein
MCCLRVSGFLTEITQQIHSFRASGVMSSHFARATASEARVFRNSAGTRCTGPEEIAFLLMNLILHRLRRGQRCRFRRVLFPWHPCEMPPREPFALLPTCRNAAENR